MTRLLPDGEFDKTFEEGRVTHFVPDDRGVGYGTDAVVIHRVNVAIQTPAFGSSIVVAAGNTIYQFSGADGESLGYRRITFTGNIREGDATTRNRLWV